MNTNKHTIQTNRQAEARISAPQPGKRTLPARKMPATAASKAAHKASSGKEVSPLETVTVVEARINVGIGNALFIRGQGDGLSWDKGQPLNCVDPSTWVWSTTHAQEKVVFKLLLNDQIWAEGEDVVVEAGQRIQLAPGF